MQYRHLPAGAIPALCAVAGGLAGVVLLRLLGTPLSVLCLLGAATSAHAFGWRIRIVRRPPGIIEQ